ncbi:MAG: deoxyuridine 5'-triphosphate nucleotidohydrolase [Candidatus Altiarchaeota archaeon]|nr:deoxyuridine 5'-triphosphate nucleotidohydrolase [Candidatus Altiarchaeota archaeon]
MFLSGEKIASFMDGVKDVQIQSAGVDLTVKTIYEFDTPGELDFSNESRNIPKGNKLDFEEKIHLTSGSYRVVYGESIKMPENAIGLVLPRSSLMRMGATLISALWDPGYHGRGQGLLVVTNPHGIILHKNARIGQITLIKGVRTGKYEGTYQKENL